MTAVETHSFLQGVSLSASDRWREGQVVELESRAIPTADASPLELSYAPSTPSFSNPIALKTHFNSQPEASRNVDELAVEYSDYWNLKVILAYTELVAAGQTLIVDRRANDIVVLLKCLARQRTFSSKHEISLQLFLGFQNGRIRQAARDALHRLYSKRFRTTTTATLEWIDESVGVCRFRHPQNGYGDVEREFSLFDLRTHLFDTPNCSSQTNLEEGVSFLLEMELDEAGRVIAYLPVRGSIRRDEPMPSILTNLRLPENIDDQESMAVYDLARRERTESKIRAAQQARISRQKEL